MRFLTVADRELRAAARRPATFRARWITAAAFFALLVWLFWVFDGFTNRRVGGEIFDVFSVLTFIYCIIIGTATTADCLSSERREGTLGLLFLTNLNSAEIVAGKLCSSALASVYGLVAIFPMLALPVLMGGVTFEYFGKTILALLVTIFFSLASGFIASVICRRQFTAIALALGLAFTYGTGLMGVATIFNAFPVRGLSGYWGDTLAAFCPLYPLMAAGGNRVFGQNYYWFSLVAVAGLSLGALALVTWRLAKSWRDQPKTQRRWFRFSKAQGAATPGQVRDTAFRRRLLDINPFFWLTGRKKISSPFFMLLALLLVLGTAYLTAPFFANLMRGQFYSLLFGSMFAWMWTGLAFHLMTTYYGAMVASQRLAEDKSTGALEMVLSTPVTERRISQGLWLGYARRMFFPVLLTGLVHIYFIWQMLTTLITTEAPVPRGAVLTGPWHLFWTSLFNLRMNGQLLEWPFVLMARGVTLALILMGTLWITIGWLGRWFGLKMKHPGFAPIVVVAVMGIPPVLLFSGACVVVDILEIDRMPEDRLVPLMVWLAFFIGMGHCALMSAWAWWKLRREFRTVVMNRYAPPVPRRWVPRWRTVGRFAAGATVLLLVGVLSVVAYFAYQNWQSHRAWVAFQADLKRKGESLAVVLPPPVADAENFMTAPAFTRLIDAGNNTALNRILYNSSRSGRTPNNLFGVAWIKQSKAPLDETADWILKKSAAPGSNRTALAFITLENLKPHEAILQELTVAARRPFLRFPTNRRDPKLFRSELDTLLLADGLQLLFAQRACAWLAVQRPNDASEDVLTALRLAHLTRQSQNKVAIEHSLSAAARGLQPIWEGLATQQWSEKQLAEFHGQLAAFDFLGDYTNAVQRAVRSHLQTWQAIPQSTTLIALPQGASYVHNDAWRYQPRGWWYDRCIQFYEVGATAMMSMDAGNGRVRQTSISWSDLSGLSLDTHVSNLLQQNSWWNNDPSDLAFVQTSVNQAIIAVALERHRRAHGGYPERLDALVPAYLERLPHDLIRGVPPGYQHWDAQYLLRGVGPNEVDDRIVSFSDDWLWAYSTNTPPVVVIKKQK